MSISGTFPGGPCSRVWPHQLLECLSVHLNNCHLPPPSFPLLGDHSSDSKTKMNHGICLFSHIREAEYLVPRGKYVKSL